MQQQKQIPVNYYPWWVAHNDDSGDQIFYDIHDPQSCYRCRIPELVGKRIRACFHGWVILSNHHYTHWFLWNPAAANSTLICLPHLRLLMKSGPVCCLSSPPDVPGSILLLATPDKPNFVFCRLDHERESPLQWVEMSYAEQLSSITGRHDKIEILDMLPCCNGEVYAGAIDRLVKIQIVDKEKSVMINLLPFVNFPTPPNTTCRVVTQCGYFTGSPLELFVIWIGVADPDKIKPIDVWLFKLDISSMVWVEKEDLKDTVLYVDMGDNGLCCAVVSKIGGYVHILHKKGKVVYSYNVKDKTISTSFLLHYDYVDWTQSYAALWPMPDPKFRLQGDGKCEGVSKANGKCKAKEDEMVVKEAAQEEEFEADDVLNLPFHVLEMILEFCVGVEYLNFRATCKLCHLAAPLIHRKVPQRRLKTYSLVSSPWLMVFDRLGGIITFTDPMFGDNYFIRAGIVSHSEVACSGHGWLLLIEDSRVAFFNPFTSEIRELPAQMMKSRFFCFSAPPTSPDCMVVRFSRYDCFLHFVAGEPIWHPLDLDNDDATPHSIKFPTICGRDVYALRDKGVVGVFREVGQDYVWEVVVDRLPTSSCSAVEYFLTTCNQHLLLLMVGDFGEGVEVFKLTKELEWEKMDGLGRHAIYICESLSSCLCMAAKTPEMENKIFFSRLHSKNGKVMFYSMETHMFHTFDGRNIGQETSLEDFYQLTYSHAWIEPTWC